MPSTATNTSGFFVTIATQKGSTTKRVDGDLLSVGRSEECNLSIAHETMSRRHLSVTVRNGECYVEDHGSANGTFLNGARMKAHAPIKIRAEDQLTLAQSGVRILVSTEPVARPEGMPPLPSDEKTVVPPIVTGTVVERTERRLAALPESRSPRESQQKAETVVLEAYKKAAHLVHEAEIEAERRVEEIYRRAHDVQAKTDDAYQKKLNEAYRSAESAFSTAQSQAADILKEARGTATQIRLIAEQTVSDLRIRTEHDCERILQEAQETARQLKESRLQEGEEDIRRREAEIVAKTKDAMNERLAKFEEDLFQQGIRRRQEIDNELALALQNIERLRVETRELQSIKVAQEESLVISQRALAIEEEQARLLREEVSRLNLVKAEISELDKSRATSRDQLTKIQEQLRVADVKVRTSQQDVQAQLLTVRAKFEEEKSRLLKDEERRLEQMKLETNRRVLALERQLLEEVQNKKDRMAREIAHLVETQIKKAGENGAVDLKKLQLAVMALVGEQLVVLSKDKTAETKQKSLIALQRREKAWSYFAGAVLGAAALVFGQHFSHLELDSSPVQQKIQTAIELRKQDLEKRKFQPPQTREYKPNYVDNVIYTQAFTDTYLSDDFQDALLTELSPYLLRMWRVDEDKTIQLLSMTTAVVKGLLDKREAIHPDFILPSIEKMRAFEKESQGKMVALLGSQVRYESFKKFEAQFYAKYASH